MYELDMLSMLLDLLFGIDSHVLASLSYWVGGEPGTTRQDAVSVSYTHLTLPTKA